MVDRENGKLDEKGFIILKPNFSSLYKQGKYTTPVSLLINRIYEYDIQSANSTMLRESGKVDESIIAELENLSKRGRSRTVGKMIRRNREFDKIIKNGILRARYQLFSMNMIQDYEIVSIKNDAVFIVGRRLPHTKFGSTVFRVKNQYSAFLQFNNIELYYDFKDKRVDIKGVNDEVVNVTDHQQGIIKFFLKIFGFLVYDNKKDLRKYLVAFVDDYKNKRLPVQYYREFNSDNCYRTIMELSGFSYNLLDATNIDLDIINPIYNYNRYILPIVQYFI